MQSEPFDNVPPGPDESSLLQDNKRRRTSERSENTAQELDSANAPTMGRRTVTRSSPQGGSSQDMTPPESIGAVKYTRTGRVSKATKGQRVHHCDECGKTYTRAEHLRRHQQNHKPGAFPCDVPGCGRSFFREDLLIRHKARHDDPNNPPSRPASPSSQDSTSMDRFDPVERLPSKSRPSTLGQSPAIAPSSTEDAEEEQPSIRSRAPNASSRHGYNEDPATYIPSVQRLDLHKSFTPFQRAGPLPLALDTSTNYSDTMLGGWQWNPSSPYSPNGYDSPNEGAHYSDSGPPYFQPHPGRDTHPSDVSYTAHYPYPQISRSPVSEGSSSMNLPPQWYQNAHNAALQHFGTSFESDSSEEFDLYDLHIGDQLSFGPLDSQQLFTAEERDLMEHDDLLVPAPSSHGSTPDPNLAGMDYTNDQRYLGAYWRMVHPFYPVVHRPTFVLTHASPLLRAAMLALGAHALPDTVDKRNARIIHERCIKVLKKRMLDGWPSSRTCDMQAIVLMDVYSIFKSRRPPPQLSKVFQDTYQRLVSDASAFSGDFSSESIPPDGTSYLNEVALSIGARCKQRLLLACFILDQHHAALFGRQSTGCFPGAGMDLPFPQSQAVWDSNYGTLSETSTLGLVREILEGGGLNNCGQHEYDVFQSMLIMASLSDADSPSYVSTAKTTSLLMLAEMEQSPRIKMAYHTLMLCKHTPVRDLLGVAGESWVMAEKLTSRAEYTAAQLEVRHWAKKARDSIVDSHEENDGQDIASAIGHALKILELYLDHPKTGLLFQEWAVYLASVILWARAYVTADKLDKVRSLSVSNQSERRASLLELDQEVPHVLTAAKRSNINLEQAKTILSWTRARIETVDIPHNCGLTNGALDVLGKLVARGAEDGWFGS